MVDDFFVSSLNCGCELSVTKLKLQSLVFMYAVEYYKSFYNQNELSKSNLYACSQPCIEFVTTIETWGSILHSFVFVYSQLPGNVV
jgi:hypothetical protein